jgi:carboxymethylenebutenolidase
MKLILPLLLMTWTAGAQDWAKQKLEKSPRHGEWVKIKSNGRDLETFVVYPEIKGKAPVVLVIHEIFGLTDWARETADRLAAEGYIAVAPDLLSGKGPGGGRTSAFASVDDAREAVSKLDEGAVIHDLDAAADYAKKIAAGNGKLVVAGFCWGGGQSFRFATHRSDLKAAFVFYGPPPQDPTAAKAPVYGFYGGNDARIGATVPGTQKAMKDAKKKYEAVTYDGAGHGFMRSGEDPEGKDGDRTARERAWTRWLTLLKKL